MEIAFCENGIRLKIEVTGEGNVRLLHLGAREPSQVPAGAAPKFRLVEVQESGMNLNDHHGSKHTGSCPGSLLCYRSHSDSRNAQGRLFTLTQEHEGLTVKSNFQFFDGIPVVRSWTELENNGKRERPIEYVSSFALTGLSAGSPLPREQGCILRIPHSTWYGEAQWKAYTPAQLGYDRVNTFSVKRIGCTSTGTWPAGEYLPMGSYENTELGCTVTWQIETSASWHWEISDIAENFYLQISGPTYQENNFLRILRSGEKFVSEPCAVAFADGGFEESIRALTQYRRRIRRPNEDDAHPSVIFNDYMNCLTGDPTTEKLLPLIDAAAEAGCRTFCIDCGWYADGFWWDGVGEWLPSKARFPNGIEEPLAYIRKKGMTPGLWLELEVMGIHCPLAQKIPIDWFFQRNGRPVIDEGRYQLDFRNPEVRAHADGVLKRLVEEYGAGYIKMDYNINPGPGTERDADSAGQGLLGHTRAYLAWLDSVFARYPSLVIENCSSGGMRMTYSFLSRQSIQSVTDQTDYLLMASIAANCSTAVAPEQAAVWSYPLRDGDEEETVFNMVNAMLLRIHQSGHLAELSPQRKELVREGIACHMSICDKLKNGLPFWPLGLANMSCEYLSFGMECGKELFLAVWHREGTKKEERLPIPRTAGRGATAACMYPSHLPCDFEWDAAAGLLTVRLEPKTARLFRIAFS